MFIVLSIFHYFFEFLCLLLPLDGEDIFDEHLFLFREIILFMLSLLDGGYVVHLPENRKDCFDPF